MASKAAALIVSRAVKSIETQFGAAAAAIALSQHGLRVRDDTCSPLKSNTCLSSAISEWMSISMVCNGFQEQI